MWVRRWGDELVITPQLQRWMFPGREPLQHADPPKWDCPSEVLAASLWNFALPLLLSLWDKQSGVGECAGTQGNASLTRTQMFVHCRSPFTLSPTEPAAFVILCLFTSITLPVLSFYILFNSTLNYLLFSHSLSLQRIRVIRSCNYILAIISLILPA